MKERVSNKISMAIFLLSALALACASLTGYAEEKTPKELRGVTIKEHLGKSLDLSIPFENDRGEKVTIGSFFEQGKPVLLTLNYYKCKMLCSLQLNALVEGVQKLGWKPGDKFRMVTVSIDPRNNAQLAHEKRESYLKSLGMGDVDWTFLVGTKANIDRLASQVGFEYKYDPVEDQYAHGIAAYFVSPTGVLSRYLYGLEYSPRNLKFALIDASSGKIGSSVDKFILSCFHYDETRGKYGPTALKVMRVGGVFTMTILGAGLLVLWRRDKKHRREKNRVV